MKNLLKLLMVFIAIAIGTASFAQVYGLKAGLNFSKQTAESDDEDYSDDIKMVPGFHIGATAEFPVNDMITFETGLILSSKGYKYDEEWEETCNLYYLDIPLNAKTYFDVGGQKVFVTLGPYLGMGLSGKCKWEGDGESGSDDVKWGSSDEDDYKRMDFGLAVGAGIELNTIRIGLSYGLGLANISSYTDGGTKINNRVLGISVAYILGGE